MPNDNLVRSAVLLMCGELLLAVMAAMIKHLAGEGLPPELIVFFRNFLGLLFLFPILFGTGGLRQLKTKRIGLHFIRAGTGVAAMFCYFYTIAHVPLADAIIVKMTAPFFLPLTAMIWLGDKITLRTWAAIAVGFLGVAVIIQPGTGAFNPVMIVALLSAVLMGVAKVSIRKMADTEPPRRIVFWFGAISSVISAIPLFWITTWPDGAQFGWLLAIGLTATIAQICMTTAYQLASPGRVGIYNYTAVIWAAALGWLFWDESLKWATLAGTLLIVAAGVWNLGSAKIKK
ncbi:MAG: DMT family transporter [Gammaproteobacteria bacterium]|nr:DMT family transporter [Gammaproteobacteria bacterium]MBQ0773906.1 DMT family transporter [Gammaproteobacteria bacterium]